LEKYVFRLLLHGEYADTNIRNLTQICLKKRGRYLNEFDEYAESINKIAQMENPPENLAVFSEHAQTNKIEHTSEISKQNKRSQIIFKERIKGVKKNLLTLLSLA
jgi:hypothetical protein